VSYCVIFPFYRVYFYLETSLMNPPSKPRRSGFTLIELLVVIAIIAILIALLVPAVQKVRAAAARSQCQNNLKNIGLALHAYHDVKKHLPPGGASQNAPYGNGGSWGFSWMVWILPYIEQGPLHNSLMQFSGSTTAFSSPGWTSRNPGPGTIIDNVLIPVYRCPSSDMTNWARSTNPGNRKWMVSDYTGNAGIGNAAMIPGYVENRVAIATETSTACCRGISCGSGVLFPNSSVKLPGIGDGTSNVIMVSEQSDSLEITTNPLRTPLGKGDYRSSSNHGWAIGVSNTNEGHLWSSTNITATTADRRMFSMVCTRFGINQKMGHTYSNAFGIFLNSPTAAPFMSTHGGGVNALMGDGRVVFLADNLPIATLGMLCVRDDARPVGDF
jgi:prepilin-type N-terminal cleavage/methylation domain-containing protein/prepilin-type processing-associated H-X9-DG protein